MSDPYLRFTLPAQIPGCYLVDTSAILVGTFLLSFSLCSLVFPHILDDKKSRQSRRKSDDKARKETQKTFQIEHQKTFIALVTNRYKEQLTTKTVFLPLLLRTFLFCNSLGSIVRVKCISKIWSPSSSTILAENL